MAMTLTGVLWDPRPTDKSDVLARILATVRAFVACTGHRREEMVLEHDLGDGRVEALPCDEAHLSDALDVGVPVDIHALSDLAGEAEVHATIEIDIDDDTPQVIVGGTPVGLDARRLLLELVEIWDASMGFHTDDPLLEVTAELPVPVGKYTWLAPGYEVVLTGFPEVTEEPAAAGWLFTFGPELGSAAILDDARRLADRMEQ